MILIALIIGILTTVIGALPPGASNLAVIKTSLQENHRESLKISYGAGIGEVVLALIAFSSGMVVQEFFEMHLWVQYVVACILATVGVFFLVNPSKKLKIKKRQRSKYFLGFMLSVINPPVLIYWILVFSALTKYLVIATETSLLWLILFLIGVFMGKFITLYGYSKVGLKLQQKKQTDKNGINRFIGVTLLVLSCIQLTKLAFL